MQQTSPFSQHLCPGYDCSLDYELCVARPQTITNLFAVLFPGHKAALLVALMTCRNPLHLELHCDSVRSSNNNKK